MPRTILSPPPRRRRSVAPILLLVLLVGLVAFLFYLAAVDTEVPTERIEQDVGNDLLGG